MHSYLYLHWWKSIFMLAVDSMTMFVYPTSCIQIKNLQLCYMCVCVLIVPLTLTLDCMCLFVSKSSVKDDLQWLYNINVNKLTTSKEWYQISCPSSINKGYFLLKTYHSNRVGKQRQWPFQVAFLFMRSQEAHSFMFILNIKLMRKFYNKSILF